MTLADFLVMLRDAGVFYETELNKKGQTEITVHSSEGEGYFGFVSCWTFDSKGKLVTVGHYE